MTNDAHVLKVRGSANHFGALEYPTLDGVPLRNVESITLTIQPDDFIRATLVMTVTPDVELPAVITGVVA